KAQGYAERTVAPFLKRAGNLHFRVVDRDLAERAIDGELEPRLAAAVARFRVQRERDRHQGWRNGVKTARSTAAGREVVEQPRKRGKRARADAGVEMPLRLFAEDTGN